MHLGISSFTYGWAVGVKGFKPADPLNEVMLLDLVKEFRIDTLQLGDNLPVHRFSRKRLNELKSRTRDGGVRLEIGARGLTQEHLRRYIELAAFLDSPLLRFITDDGPYKPGVTQVIEIIGQALPELKNQKIKLGIENHDRLKARELALIADSVNDPNVGICLDCVNSIGAGEGLEHVVDILAPYTINLHVKDFLAERLPHKMGFRIIGARAGKGMTDIPRLLDKIVPYKRCESAILEQWVEPESSLERSISKEKLWAAEGIAFLKKLMDFHNNHKKR